MKQKKTNEIEYNFTEITIFKIKKVNTKKDILNFDELWFPTLKKLKKIYVK